MVRKIRNTTRQFRSGRKCKEITTSTWKNNKRYFSPYVIVVYKVMLIHDALGTVMLTVVLYVEPFVIFYRPRGNHSFPCEVTFHATPLHLET